MARTFLIFPAVAALSLVACQRHTTSTTTVARNTQTGWTTTTTGTSSSSSSLIPSASALVIQPGKWETRREVLEVTMSGLPAGISAPKPATQTATSCLSPEDAAKGPEEMLKSANSACQTAKSVFADGKIELEMTCSLPSGTIHVSSHGVYSATQILTDTVVTRSGKVSGSEKSHTIARRVGNCG